MLQPLNETTPEFSTPVQYCDRTAPLVPVPVVIVRVTGREVRRDHVARGVLDRDGGLRA